MTVAGNRCRNSVRVGETCRRHATTSSVSTQSVSPTPKPQTVRVTLETCPGAKNELVRLHRHNITTMYQLWAYYYTNDKDHEAMLNYVQFTIGMSKVNAERCVNFMEKRSIELGL